jgi:hypothetical protein
MIFLSGWDISSLVGLLFVRSFIAYVIGAAIFVVFGLLFGNFYRLALLGGLLGVLYVALPWVYYGFQAGGPSDAPVRVFFIIVLPSIVSFAIGVLLTTLIVRLLERSRS